MGRGLWWVGLMMGESWWAGSAVHFIYWVDLQTGRGLWWVKLVSGCGPWWVWFFCGRGLQCSLVSVGGACRAGTASHWLPAGHLQLEFPGPHPEWDGSSVLVRGVLDPPQPHPAASLPGRRLRPHEPLCQVPTDCPRHEPGSPESRCVPPPRIPPDLFLPFIAFRRPCAFPQVLDVPVTVKIRTGVQERVNLAHRLLPELRDWGAALVTVGLGVQGVGCGPSPSGARSR